MDRPAVASQRGERVPGGDVPDLHRAVLAAGHESPPVVRKRDAIYVRRMARERVDLLACFEVVHVNYAIEFRGGAQRAVGGKGE